MSKPRFEHHQGMPFGRRHNQFETYRILGSSMLSKSYTFSNERLLGSVIILNILDTDGAKITFDDSAEQSVDVDSSSGSGKIFFIANLS